MRNGPAEGAEWCGCEDFPMRLTVLRVFAAVAAVLLAGPAFADAAGVAKGVDPQADALSKGQTKTLVVGADIFIGDKLTTGPEGLVQIVFADNTKLAVGPNSSLLIEDYLVRNNGTAGKFAIDMLGGSFRFITGTGPKSAYQINTPTGTIGVRGTIFDVFVDIVTGQAWVMMYRGVTAMQSGGDTKLLNGLCHVGTIDLDETAIIGHADGINGDDRDEFKEHFLFSIDQSKLLPEFRVAASTQCTRRPASDNNDSIYDGAGTSTQDCYEGGGSGSYGILASEGCYITD
jgi:hypothetical protein